MPISYGQVVGRKYTAIQPEYDPENPKPTKYPATSRSWSGDDARGRPPETRIFKHGVNGWAKHHCTCPVCTEAYDKYLANQRERKNDKKRAQHERGDKVLCRRCHQWQPRQSFPSLDVRGSSLKYVCRSCRDKGAKA